MTKRPGEERISAHSNTTTGDARAEEVLQVAFVVFTRHGDGDSYRLVRLPSRRVGVDPDRQDRSASEEKSA